MGAVDLLHHLRAAGFRLDVAGDKLLVSPADKLTDDDCARITTHKPTLLALRAWTDADIARFHDRRARLLRWGWAESEAEKLAERLVKRDREADPRVSCTECAHFRPWRCGNYRAALMIDSSVGPDLAATLQRCPGFADSRPAPT